MVAPYIAIFCWTLTIGAFVVVFQNLSRGALVGTIVFIAFVFSEISPRKLQSSFAYLGRGAKHILWRKHHFDFSKIDEGLYLGRMPRNAEDLQLLKAEGITTIIAVTEPWELLVPLEEKARQFTLLHLETPDYFSPTPEQIEQGVRLIEEKSKLGQSVYVHCFAGKGRSAVIVISYLIWKLKLDPQKAWEFAKGKRPVVANIPGFFGLKPQWKAINQWRKEYCH